MATPDHNIAPIASAGMNRQQGNPEHAGHRGGDRREARDELATISDRAPQRVKMDSVCRTHESGDSEILHSVRSTGPPNRRPVEYHARSAISEAATAVASSAASE